MPYTLNLILDLHFTVIIVPRYFESGICSVYLWDLDHGFAGVVLIKKAGDNDKIKGCWDSIHVVEVQVSLLSFSNTYNLPFNAHPLHLLF